MTQTTRAWSVRAAMVGLIVVIISYWIGLDDDVQLDSLAEPAAENPGISPMGRPVTPVGTPSATGLPTPVVTVEIITVTEPVPFEAVTVDDSTAPAGTSTVTTVGVAGVRTLTYEVVYTDGVETGRTVVGDEVTVPPVDEVTTVGTAAEPEVNPLADLPENDGGCDPNYDGCVPIASDVDCAGGSGNGPAYADGPVHVVGSDIYDLDRDSDGVACE